MAPFFSILWCDDSPAFGAISRWLSFVVRELCFYEEAEQSGAFIMDISTKIQTNYRAVGDEEIKETWGAFEQTTLRRVDCVSLLSWSVVTQLSLTGLTRSFSFVYYPLLFIRFRLRWISVSDNDSAHKSFSSSQISTHNIAPFIS